MTSWLRVHRLIHLVDGEGDAAPSTRDPGRGGGARSVVKLPMFAGGVRYCSHLGARVSCAAAVNPVSTAAGRTPMMWTARRLWIVVFLIALAAGAPAAAAPCA